MSGTAILETEAISKSFGGLTAVDRVSVSIEQGQITGLIGPNGAGKSTLLKSIVGLTDIDSGTIELGGEDITGVAPEKVIYHGICHVPQVDNIFPNLTVLENLKMGAWALGDTDVAFESRVQEVYERFPVLEDRPDQQASTLSGGQQQMVAMGAALMLDPDLLILDEPSAGLAPQLVDDVFEKITEIRVESDTAVLMIEQNARRALQESDRGIVLDLGEKRMGGAGEKLLDSNEVQELYLGA